MDMVQKKIMRLMVKHPNKFVSPNSTNVEITDRPLWSLLGSSLSRFTTHHAIIIAGTHIGVKSEKTIESSLAKPLRRKIVTIQNFRFV